MSSSVLSQNREYVSSPPATQKPRKIKHSHGQFRGNLKFLTLTNEQQRKILFALVAKIVLFVRTRTRAGFNREYDSFDSNCLSYARDNIASVVKGVLFVSHLRYCAFCRLPEGAKSRHCQLSELQSHSKTII